MHLYKVKSPVLLLVFNRPTETQKIFNMIKKAAPSKLYVGADAPRHLNENDEILCAETRKIIGEVDWECEVKSLYREKNLGCRNAVSDAITWFFENEEEGIILEDDCLPSLDFFRFCDELLEKYRGDNRIGHICGCNFQDELKGSADYYFSKLTHVWGWASWKRVWSNYDISMKNLELANELDFLSSVTDNKQIKRSLYKVLQETKKGGINTWDYQYMYSNIINGYLSVIPNNNMISNIGFASAGTHTLDMGSPNANRKFQPLPLKIKHPPLFVADRQSDTNTLANELPGFIKRYFSIFRQKANKIINP